jgi:hypothetical protein
MTAHIAKLTNTVVATENEELEPEIVILRGVIIG